MDNTSLQSSLLALLRQARRVELAWISTLSETECETNGTLEHWSAKNLLAHISAWKKRGVEKLALIERSGIPPQLDSLDQFNEKIFVASQNHSWQEVQNEAEQAFTNLIVQVEQLSEKIFANPEEIIWQVMACGGKHPYRHLSEFALQQGDVKHATLLYEELIDTMRLMPLPISELGRAIYQLAGFYAMTGQQTKAVEELKLAIQLEPGAAEWARQDSNLSELPLPE